MLLAMSIVVSFVLLAAVTVAGQAVIERSLRPAGRLVEAGGGTLHIAEMGVPGSADEAPLVLLHGASGNLEDMRLALGETLARRWRVLLLDRPGHGLSSRSGGVDDASPARQATLIHDALGRLGVKRPILVAHSLGGAVATAYALGFPDDVSGLVLIAPTTHPWEGGIAWYYSLATAPVIGPLFAWTYALPVGSLLVPNAIASVFAPQAPPADYQSRAGIMQVLRPKTFLANAQDVAALNGNLRKQFERYRDIGVPTVVITGDRDQTVSLDIHARALAAAIPDARLEILEGVGHMPHHARPHRIEAAVAHVQEAARGR
jgi:pimeloyl-ACP methyl ester carboxylesterase